MGPPSGLRQRGFELPHGQRNKEPLAKSRQKRKVFFFVFVVYCAEAG